MNKVVVTSFATKDFEPYRKRMIRTAKKFGLKHFLSYNEEWLDKTGFIQQKPEFFRHQRGYGLWIWKPFVILETLRNIDEGDVVFYVDSGCEFINSPSELIRIAATNKTGIVAFDCEPVKNRRFVKREAFIKMECNSEKYWNSVHVIATVILFKKCDKTVSFVSEWLEFCKNIEIMSPERNTDSKGNFPDFNAHREDQSVLSLLIKKYDVATYRNPSKWGNFLKVPEMRIPGEYIGYPYHLEDSIKNYSDNPNYNSHYPTIFYFNKKQDPVKNTQTFYEKVFKKILQFTKRK